MSKGKCHHDRQHSMDKWLPFSLQGGVWGLLMLTVPRFHTNLSQGTFP